MVFEFARLGHHPSPLDPAQAIKGTVKTNLMQRLNSMDGIFKDTLPVLAAPSRDWDGAFQILMITAFDPDNGRNLPLWLAVRTTVAATADTENRRRARLAALGRPWPPLAAWHHCGPRPKYFARERSQLPLVGIISRVRPRAKQPDGRDSEEMSLVFKCVAPCSRTAFIAVSGERVIGHICKELLEDGGFRWSWRLDVGEPTAPTAVSGFADDRESAEAALTDHWARWLADARLREG